MTNRERKNRVNSLIAELLARGEVIDKRRCDALIKEHPDLLPELGEELKRLRQLDAARAAAVGPMDGDKSDDGACASEVGDSTDFADSPSRASEFARALRQPIDAPAQIGPYKILEPLGEGGMGVVYLAEQKHPVRRRVALKLIKIGMDTKSVIARFEVERHVLELMNHVNVAKVLDAGSSETGRPYFVMEYVPGIPITEYCDKHRLSTKERLALFIDVCHAVQHAHQKGIIHRDIKPSNVLVTVQDGKPLPKVIDFGVAKATDHRLTEETIFTEQGQLIGTPEYMSPEQAEMTALDIDTRTDIYSLGVLLYELLVGALPFENQALRQAGYAEIQRLIREVDPPKPSTRLSSLGAESQSVLQKRRTELRALSRELRGDLDWIVMKCLEKDRNRRYETANAVVMEINRHLSNEPVVAGPPSVMYRMRKFVRRNSAAVLSVGLIALVLVGSSAGMAHLYYRADRARRLSVEEATRAARAANLASAERVKAHNFAMFMEGVFRGTAPAVALGRDITLLKDLMDAAVERIERGRLTASPEAEIRVRRVIGGVYVDIGKLDSAERVLVPTLDLARRYPGANSMELALVLSELGHVRFRAGRYAEALMFAAEELEIERRHYPVEHQVLIAGIGNVANVLDELGRSSEALPLREEALTIARRNFPDDHPVVRDARGSLAMSLSGAGRHDDALVHVAAVAESYRRQFRGDHPALATALHNLAAELKALGRHVEALAAADESLSIRRRVHAEGHAEIAATLELVADCYTEVGNFVEALPRAEQALDMTERLFGGDHPRIVRSQGCLSEILLSLGQKSEALALAEKSHAMAQRLFVGDHPLVADGLTKLAICLFSVSEPQEALNRFEESLAMRRRLYLGDHPLVASSLANVGTCLVSLDRAGEALPLIEEAIDVYGRVSRPSHKSVLIAEVGKGEAFVRLKRYAEAECLLVPLWGKIAERADMPQRSKSQCLEALAKLFEGLAANGPGNDYAVEAAKWRAKLEELPLASVP